MPAALGLFPFLKPHWTIEHRKDGLIASEAAGTSSDHSAVQRVESEAAVKLAPGPTEEPRPTPLMDVAVGAGQA